MNAVILVGLRRGQAERDRNWAHNRSRWEQMGIPIYEGYHEDEGPYCMSIASNRAARSAGDWDVCLYVGADFYTQTLEQAHAALTKALQTNRLTFAHTHLTLLEEDESQSVVAGETIEARGIRHANTFSGAIAVSRWLWDAVGGFDERFIGWGGEDLAFWSACCAIGRRFERMPGDMFHLWHPRSWEENEGSPTYPPNDVLMRRYINAKGDRTTMMSILREEGGPLYGRKNNRKGE